MNFAVSMWDAKCGVLNEGGKGGERGSYLTVLRVEVSSAHSPLGHLSELEVLAAALMNPINT